MRVTDINIEAQAGRSASMKMGRALFNIYIFLINMDYIKKKKKQEANYIYKIRSSTSIDMALLMSRVHRSK